MVLEGDSTGVILQYTGVGTGLIIDSTTQRERWGLVNISLYSTTGSKALDYTYGNYGFCSNFEIAYTATNAILIYATGQNGLGPYFNSFSDFTLFPPVLVEVPVSA